MAEINKPACPSWWRCPGACACLTRSVWWNATAIQKSHLRIVTSQENPPILTSDLTQMNSDVHVFGMKTEEIATLIKSGMCSSFPARLCHSLPSSLSWGRMPWPYAFTPGFRTKPGFVPALQAHHNLAVQAVHCQSPSSRSLGPPVHPSRPVSTRLWLSDSPPSVCCVS